VRDRDTWHTAHAAERDGGPGANGAVLAGTFASAGPLPENREVLLIKAGRWSYLQPETGTLAWQAQACLSLSGRMQDSRMGRAHLRATLQALSGVTVVSGVSRRQADTGA
jgi:hypothetical protein